MNRNRMVVKLVTGALMIALATALSYVKVFSMPNGGSVTLASMTPIILFALLYDVKWAFLVSTAYALLQMVVGFYPPPVQDFSSFFLVVTLDYLLAFGLLALAGPVSRACERALKNGVVGAVVGTVAVVALRFLCHFGSGLLIWSVYAPEGQPAWLYSLGYNGPYMLGEFIITVVTVGILYPILKRTVANRI